MPAPESPYGSANVLKVLYKKLQDFAKDHNNKYKDVPNAQFSASDILNLALIELLLQLTPDDKEVLKIKKEAAIVEEAIRAAISEVLSSSKGSDNTA